MTIRVLLVAAIWAALIGAVAGSAYAQSPATPKERFVLTGVVFVGDGRGLAWLQEPTFTNNQAVAVRPGDKIGPYRVAKVLEDQVVLEGPDGTVSIPLAGGPGTATAAVGPGTPKSPAGEPAAHPAIVIPRGDPRRNFPGSLVLVGAGARITGPVASRASQPNGSEPPAPSQPKGSEPQAASPQQAVPTSTSVQAAAPQLPPHRGLNNPNEIVIPRGDPRRAFPAADFLIGAR